MSNEITNMMLKDSKDLLDDVEINDIASECVKLKQKEDEIASLEEQLKSKKAEADDIGSRIIPELLAEQGLSEIKLSDGSKVSVKKEFRATVPKDDVRRQGCLQWLRDQGLGDIIKNIIDKILFIMVLIHNRYLMCIGPHFLLYIRSVFRPVWTCLLKTLVFGLKLKLK